MSDNAAGRRIIDVFTESATQIDPSCESVHLMEMDLEALFGESGIFKHLPIFENKTWESWTQLTDEVLLQLGIRDFDACIRIRGAFKNFFVMMGIRHSSGHFTDLNSSSHDFTIITNAMQKTIVFHKGHEGGLFNKYTIEKYFHRKKFMAESNRGFVNEVMVFHGSAFVDLIAEQGFNLSLASKKGFFGAGAYFALNSSKSNRFVFGGKPICPLHKDPSCYTCVRKILLCKVLLGRSKSMPTKSPFCHSPNEYNSVMGLPSDGGLEHRECVVYQNDLALPTHVITYRIARPNKKSLEKLLTRSEVKVIIVGGGLAGICAAIEARWQSAKVVIVEKQMSLGGNSVKAISGINAAMSKSQLVIGINDSVDTFVKDILSNGDGYSNPKLVKILATDSARAIEFLRWFELNLDDVVQLGGHSIPRTHRIPPTADGKPVPVGLTIVSTLTKYIEKYLNGSIQILVNSAFKSLIFEGVRVVGIKYEAADKTEHELRGTVILTAGGYSSDHSSNSLLQNYVPKLAKLPTTNGPWATGDIIKATVPNGLSLIHMDRVQVHPTGFVDPANPNHHTKVLAPEELRGCGAIMLNAEGRRFVDELGRRDHVTEAIFKHCKHFQGDDKMPVVSVMLLNEEVINRFGAPSADDYKMKGIIQDVGKLNDLANHLKVDASIVKGTLDLYKKAAEAGKDEFGKVTFPVVFSPEDHFYLAYITPALHYCMGGLKISEKGEVLRHPTGEAEERPVPGLYAAGEVTGGVHGNNCLGGNSLLECVIFGRLAGFHASRYRLDC